MALSKAQYDIMLHRRDLVAQLRLRGVRSERKIAQTLAEAGHINPATKEAWSSVTIHDDLKALEAQWVESMGAATEHHKAGILAEIREARLAAWGKKDLSAVGLFLKQEITLLGLDAPRKLDPALINALAERTATEMGQPVNDVLAEFEQLVGVSR